jgi:hypothetical protein
MTDITRTLCRHGFAEADLRCDPFLPDRQASR